MSCFELALGDRARDFLPACPVGNPIVFPPPPYPPLTLLSFLAAQGGSLSNTKANNCT